MAPSLKSMAVILQSLSPARQHDLHPEQRQPKYPNPATTPLKIGILGKAQQAYVAIARGNCHQ
jgi:hypothetical protein